MANVGFRIGISPQKELSGMTLIELMIVLAVLVIVAIIATPSMTSLIKDNRFRSHQSDIFNHFEYARAEALRRGNRVAVSAINSSNSANEWGLGLRVWFDSDGDGVYDAGEELRVLNTDYPSLIADGTNNTTTFSYRANGQTSLTTSLVISICDDRIGETGRQLTLLTSGMTSVNMNYSCP